MNRKELFRLLPFIGLMLSPLLCLFGAIWNEKVINRMNTKVPLKGAIPSCISLLILMFSVAAIFSGCGEPYNKSNTTIVNGLLCEAGSDKPITGDWIEKYPNDVIKEKGQIREGLKDGLFESFHENNKLRDSIRYIDGQRNGFLIRYDSAGTVREKGEYSHDKKHGAWKKFQDNGKIYEFENWAEGRRDGPYERYYQFQEKDSVPQILVEGSYTQDSMIGVWKKYYRNNILNAEIKDFRVVEEGCEAPQYVARVTSWHYEMTSDSSAIGELKMKGYCDRAVVTGSRELFYPYWYNYEYDSDENETVRSLNNYLDVGGETPVSHGLNWVYDWATQSYSYQEKFYEGQNEDELRESLISGNEQVEGLEGLWKLYLDEFGKYHREWRFDQDDFFSAGTISTDVIYVKDKDCDGFKYVPWFPHNWWGETEYFKIPTLRPTASSIVYNGEGYKDFEVKVIDEGLLTFEYSVHLRMDRRTWKGRLVRLAPTTSSKANESETGWSANGSGVVLSSLGYVVTNFHVIDGAEKIEVDIPNDEGVVSYEAEVAVADKRNDLAILKLSINEDSPAIDEPEYTLDFSLARNGSEVFAYGYPLALSVMGSDLKITDGIISAQSGYDGDISTYQISAPIQPGNSGGGLFDSNGCLIGICSSGLKTEITENVSYAIKSSYLQPLIGSLNEKIKVPQSGSIRKLSVEDQVQAISRGIVLIKVD